MDLGASVILAEIDAMGAGASSRCDTDPEVSPSLTPDLLHSIVFAFTLFRLLTLDLVSSLIRSKTVPSSSAVFAWNENPRSFYLVLTRTAKSASIAGKWAH